MFLARSDPALNYGMLAAALLVKVALYRLARLERTLGIPIYPILGAGSAPFRGNFRPDTVERYLREHPSVQTFTIQSAFKYDHPAPVIVQAIETIRRSPRGEPWPVESEPAVLDLIERTSACYRRQVQHLAPVVNTLAPLVPRRRARKLHIGLFGYSRNVGGISLPRAIPFCAALYSLGLPPEILGLAGLRPGDRDLIRRVYPAFEADLGDALRYLNDEALRLLPPGEVEETRKALRLLRVDPEPDPAHRETTSKVLQRLQSGSFEGLSDLILQAAWVRRFLG